MGDCDEKVTAKSGFDQLREKPYFLSLKNEKHRSSNTFIDDTKSSS